VTAAVLHTASRFFERRAAAIFLMAPLTLVIVMAIFPLVMSLGLAFVHWNVANPAAGVTWAGLDHWSRLGHDDHFHRVALNTVLYVVIGVPIQYGLGLMLAVVLNEELKAKAFFRLLFLLPMMLSPVAISFIVGRVMFNEALGPINYVQIEMGVPDAAQGVRRRGGRRIREPAGRASRRRHRGSVRDAVRRLPDRELQGHLRVPAADRGSHGAANRPARDPREGEGVRA